MKLKELLNNENFLSMYGDYETLGNSYTAVKVNDKLQLVFDVQKPKPKTAWDLKDGDEYFYHYGNDVYKTHWGNSEHYDQLRIFVGDVFLTKEEALRDVERRKVEALLLKHGGRRWFKKYGDNYYFWVTHAGSELRTAKTCGNLQGVIYFDSEGEIMKATEEIGADRIKKALFEVR